MVIADKLFIFVSTDSDEITYPVVAHDEDEAWRVLAEAQLKEDPESIIIDDDPEDAVAISVLNDDLPEALEELVGFMQDNWNLLWDGVDIDKAMTKSKVHAMSNAKLMKVVKQWRKTSGYKKRTFFLPEAVRRVR